MDIPRKDLVRKRRVRRIVYSVLAVLAMGAITFALSRLEPASPTVDGSPFIDEVRRGDMVLDVRGLGTLVPENILLVPARDEGRVEQRFLLPGEQVEPDTILFRLSNPQLEQDVFDTEAEIRAAEADYANLEVQLETETLSQRVNAASVESQYKQAQTEFMAQKQMAEKGLTDEVTLTTARVMAEQLEISVQLEKERAAIPGKGRAGAVGGVAGADRAAKAFAGVAPGKTGTADRTCRGDGRSSEARSRGRTSGCAGDGVGACVRPALPESRTPHRRDTGQGHYVRAAG